MGRPKQNTSCWTKLELSYFSPANQRNFRDLRKICPRASEMLKACVEAVALSAVSGYCVAFCLTWLLRLPQADLSLHESPGGLLWEIKGLNAVWTMNGTLKHMQRDQTYKGDRIHQQDRKPSGLGKARVRVHTRRHAPTVSHFRRRNNNWRMLHAPVGGRRCYSAQSQSDRKENTRSKSGHDMIHDFTRCVWAFHSGQNPHWGRGRFNKKKNTNEVIEKKHKS